MTTLRMHYRMEGKTDAQGEAWALHVDRDGDTFFTRWVQGAGPVEGDGVCVHVGLGTSPRDAARLLRKMAGLLERDGMPFVVPDEFGDLSPEGQAFARLLAR